MVRFCTPEMASSSMPGQLVFLDHIRSMAKKEQKHTTALLFFLNAARDSIEIDRPACQRYYHYLVTEFFQTEQGNLSDSKKLISRLLFYKFQMDFEKFLLKKYLVSRNEFCLKSCKFELISKIKPSEIPKYFMNIERELCNLYSNNLEIEDGNLFLRELFIEQRNNWLFSGFSKNLPKLFVYLGLCISFIVAYSVWKKNLGMMKPFDGLISWLNFLLSLF
jgi:hypothetical protein